MSSSPGPCMTAKVPRLNSTGTHEITRKQLSKLRFWKHLIFVHLKFEISICLHEGFVMYVNYLGLITYAACVFTWHVGRLPFRGSFLLPQNIIRCVSLFCTVFVLMVNILLEEHYVGICECRVVAAVISPTEISQPEEDAKPLLPRWTVVITLDLQSILRGLKWKLAWP